MEKVTHICIECTTKMNVNFETGRTAQIAACPKCTRIQKVGT